MNGGTEKAWLNPYYLLIALAPALVFIINQLLIQHIAEPFDLLPTRLAEFDVHKEGAARTGMLAAFMLFIGGTLASLLFFAYTLLMLEWQSRIRMIVAFLALAGAAVQVGIRTQGREPHEHVGKSLTCLVTGYDMPQSLRARADELARLKASPPASATPANPPGSTPTPPVQAAGVAVEHLANRQDCAHERFTRIRQLGEWQFYALIFAFSGLVFGAICCLATRPAQAPATDEPDSQTLPATSTATPVSPPLTTPPGGPVTQPATDSGADSPELRHWEKQSAWLNTYLYLAALLLGTTLVFINAYLRLPAFALIETVSYEAHVAALVSYYGFAFTVMLAAFYIPVATILSSKVSTLKAEAPGESKLPAAFKGPLQILKIVLGLFGTALAGVLPNILGLIA